MAGAPVGIDLTMRTDLAMDGPVSGGAPLAGARPRPRGEAAPAVEPGGAAALADRRPAAGAGAGAGAGAHAGTGAHAGSPDARPAPEHREHSQAPDRSPARTAARPGAEAHRGRWLYGPAVDFLLLGGGSFLVLGAMAAFFPRDEASKVALAGAMLFLAHFVNHPHFAHSYQIFYRGFVRKAFGPASPLAARYRFAGVLVPAVLAVFFAMALAEGNVALLGLAANVMLFTVGWHYAKQGFGILMLDAARKGIRFGPAERRRLLWNTHLTWVMYWLVANDALAAKELWGITYYMLDVPDPLLVAMVAAVAVSTLAVGRDLFAKWRTERALPLNGIVAYVAAVYVWLAVSRLDPVLLLVTPFFHSLQYLAVVWRYQLNVEADRSGGELRTRGEGMDSGAGNDAEPDRPAHADGSAGAAHAAGDGERGWKAWLRSAPAGLARFLVVGGILGFAGFWAAPVTVGALSGYDQAVFGATLFIFIGWTFINIHHYFIDNVIWRRDNPEAHQYLFTASGRPAPIGGRDGQTQTCGWHRRLTP